MIDLSRWHNRVGKTVPFALISLQDTNEQTIEQEGSPKWQIRCPRCSFVLFVALLAGLFVQGALYLSQGVGTSPLHLGFPSPLAMFGGLHDVSP